MGRFIADVIDNEDELGGDECVFAQDESNVVRVPISMVLNTEVLQSKATGTDVDEGTDDVKYMTSKSIEDSSYVKSNQILDKTSDRATGTDIDNAKNGTLSEAEARYKYLDALNVKYSSIVFTSDLTSYATTTQLNNKVDKVTGKSLSANDFTDALKTKLDGIETGAEVNPDLSGYSLKNDRASNLVINSARSEYDAGTIIDDTYRYRTVDALNLAYSNVAFKSDIPDVSNKVDKVTGKGLSANDFTNTLKTKLDFLSKETHAQAYLSKILLENRNLIADYDFEIYGEFSTETTKTSITSQIYDRSYTSSLALENPLNYPPVSNNPNHRNSLLFGYYEDNYLKAKSSSEVLSVFNNSSKSVAIFCVFEHDNIAPSSLILGFYDSTKSGNSGNRFGLIANNDGNDKLALQTPSGAFMATNTYLWNTPLVACMQRDSNTNYLSLFINGNIEVFQSDSVGTADNFILGADMDTGGVLNQYFNGHIYRIMIYDRLFTNEQIRYMSSLFTNAYYTNI